MGTLVSGSLKQISRNCYERPVTTRPAGADRGQFNPVVLLCYRYLYRHVLFEPPGSQIVWYLGFRFSRRSLWLLRQLVYLRVVLLRYRAELHCVAAISKVSRIPFREIVGKAFGGLNFSHLTLGAEARSWQ